MVAANVRNRKALPSFHRPRATEADASAALYLSS